MAYTLQIGSIRCHIVDDGRQWVDGGGFFGLVPRVLWERVVQPDALNRIPTALRCLLIESDRGLILVDTAQGDKLTPKMRQRLSMEERNLRLVSDIRSVGFEPEEVDVVLLTHLHGDHCGGSTRWDSDDGSPGPVVPTFPRARYLVQRLELAAASFPNERTRGTYFPENWEPLQERGLLEVVDGDLDLAPGVRTQVVPGHTESIQVVWVESGGESLLFLGDTCSWAVHMERLAWVPAYDILPMSSIEGKRNLRRAALRKDALLVFQHDARVVVGRLEPEEDHRVRVVPVIQEEDPGS